MNAFLSTAILLTGLTQASSGTAAELSDLQASTPSAGWAVSQSAWQPPVVAGTAVASGDNIIGLPLSISQESVRDNVLVVPTPDLPAESLADLTEDLAVMCRIFDKTLPPSRASMGVAYGGYGTRGDVLTLPFGPQSPRTQGLYLDGYGALFFIPVNYPLAPTEPPEPAQAQPKESADTVWSQTIREMSGQPTDEGQTERTAPVYDAQRVETLKKTLTRTLAHAANIRMRRPQDVITLVVGDLDAGSRPSTSRVEAFSTNGRVRSSRTQSTSSSSVAARNPASALLVLRTTKADVDAFAKGQLTLVQFTDKIQSLWSPPDQATPATAPAPTTGARR